MSGGLVTSTDGLRAGLEGSRARLLEAIGRLTEADFARELEPGLSVLALLDGLGREERAAVATARREVGLAERRGGGARTPSELAPQVIHDLAGARHETLRLLAEVEEGALTAVAPAVLGIVERESGAAARIHSARAPE